LHYREGAGDCADLRLIESTANKRADLDSDTLTSRTGLVRLSGPEESAICLHLALIQLRRFWGHFESAPPGASNYVRASRPGKNQRPADDKDLRGMLSRSSYMAGPILYYTLNQKTLLHFKLWPLKRVFLFT